MKKNLSGKKVDNNNNNKKMIEVKKNGKIDRDGGFYLKVGLPFFNLGSKEKKKKKKESKVSPRPSISDGYVKEKEWWKKSNHPSVYKESDDSAASSMNSNGSIKSSTSSSSNSSIRSRGRRMRSNSTIRYVSISNLIVFFLLALFLVMLSRYFLSADISWNCKFYQEISSDNVNLTLRATRRGEEQPSGLISFYENFISMFCC
jgi:hypothetical protein